MIAFCSSSFCSFLSDHTFALTVSFVGALLAPLLVLFWFQWWHWPLSLENHHKFQDKLLCKPHNVFTVSNNSRSIPKINLLISSDLIVHIHRLVDKNRSCSMCKLHCVQLRQTSWSAALGSLVIRWILTRSIQFKNWSYKYAICAVIYWSFCCLVVLSLKKTNFAMSPS